MSNEPNKSIWDIFYKIFQLIYKLIAGYDNLNKRMHVVEKKVAKLEKKDL